MANAVGTDANYVYFYRKKGNGKTTLIYRKPADEDYDNETRQLLVRLNKNKDSVDSIIEEVRLRGRGSSDNNWSIEGEGTNNGGLSSMDIQRTSNEGRDIERVVSSVLKANEGTTGKSAGEIRGKVARALTPIYEEAVDNYDLKKAGAVVDALAKSLTFETPIIPPLIAKKVAQIVRF